MATFIVLIVAIEVLPFEPPFYVYPGLLLVSMAALVMELRANQPRPGVYCEHCDYNLAGLPADATACPECGGKIGPAAAKAP